MISHLILASSLLVAAPDPWKIILDAGNTGFGRDFCEVEVDTRFEMEQRDGVFYFRVVDLPNCEKQPPSCSPPDGFTVVNSINYELNSAARPEAFTYSEVFGSFPASPAFSGGTFSLQIFVNTVHSLPLTVTEDATGYSWFSWSDFGGTGNIRVSISSCEGSVAPEDSAVDGNCFAQGGGAGGDFFPGTVGAVNVGGCNLPPGNYWFNIAAVDFEEFNGCPAGTSFCFWRPQVRLIQE